MPAWDDLRYFLELCRAGTFAAAARQLRVDETTVGRRVAKLERELGAKLVERTPERFVLTEVGESVRASAEGMEQAAQAVERRALGADARPSGRVRLTTPELLGRHFVLPSLRALHRRHPGICIELITSVSRLDVSRREADLAVRTVRPTEPALISRRLGRLAMAPYVLRDAPRQASGQRTEVVTYADGVRLPMRNVEDRLPGATIPLRTNSTTTVLEAVRQGWGIGDLPCFLADGMPELRRALPESPPELLDIWLIAHADLQHTVRVRSVIQHLVETFESGASILEGKPLPEARTGLTRKRARRPSR